MDEGEQARIAHNEASFRSVNEALRAGTSLVEARKLLPFRCECGVLGCNQLLELSLEEYEAVRAHPQRFLLVAGHEIPGAERVVERHERFWVVEKIGDAAEVAERTDPRGGGAR